MHIYYKMQAIWMQLGPYSKLINLICSLDTYIKGQQLHSSRYGKPLSCCSKNAGLQDPYQRRQHIAWWVQGKGSESEKSRKRKYERSSAERGKEEKQGINSEMARKGTECSTTRRFSAWLPKSVFTWKSCVKGRKLYHHSCGGPLSLIEKKCHTPRPTCREKRFLLY